MQDGGCSISPERQCWRLWNDRCSNTHKTPSTAPGSYTAYKAHSFLHILSFLQAPIPREMTPYLGSQVSPKGGQSREAGILCGYAELSLVADLRSKLLSSAVINYHFPQIHWLGPPAREPRLPDEDGSSPDGPVGVAGPFTPSCSSSGFSNMGAQSKLQGAGKQDSMLWATSVPEQGCA